MYYIVYSTTEPMVTQMHGKMLMNWQEADRVSEDVVKQLQDADQTGQVWIVSQRPSDGTRHIESIITVGEPDLLGRRLVDFTDKDALWGILTH